MEVRAEVELVAVEGRRLTFAVKVFDERGLIGEGRHQRAVIDCRALPRARAGEGGKRAASAADLILVIARRLSGRNFLVVTAGGLDARPA